MDTEVDGSHEGRHRPSARDSCCQGTNGHEVVRASGDPRGKIEIP